MGNSSSVDPEETRCAEGTGAAGSAAGSSTTISPPPLRSSGGGEVIGVEAAAAAMGAAPSISDPQRTAATPKTYVGCNWKCSLEKVADVDKLIDELNAMWRTLASTTDVTSKIELCVNPPYVFVDRCRAKLCSSIRVGSQNVFDANGPNKGNTAATTANMLASVGVEWVLLGHADRRNTLGETDALIADKVRATAHPPPRPPWLWPCVACSAIVASRGLTSLVLLRGARGARGARARPQVKACVAAGLGVNLTIGDLKSQRDAGLADATLTKQLGVAAGAIPADAWGSVVVAYEPVWAVGDGATPCSPEEAQRINSVLRKVRARRPWAVCGDLLVADRGVHRGGLFLSPTGEFTTRRRRSALDKKQPLPALRLDVYILYI